MRTSACSRSSSARATARRCAARRRRWELAFPPPARSTAWSTASRPTASRSAIPATRAGRPGVGDSVVEFPGYRPPAWLAAPDPGPAEAVAEHARLWSPPDTDPRWPLPLLVAHDGTDYERAAAADAPRRPRDRQRPASRRAASRCSTRRTATRPTPPRARYARALAALAPAARAGDRARGLGASLGALALLHARWLHPRLVRRADAAVRLLLPPALGPPRGRLRALRPDLALRRQRAARGPRRDARSRSR